MNALWLSYFLAFGTIIEADSNSEVADTGLMYGLFKCNAAKARRLCNVLLIHVF